MAFTFPYLTLSIWRCCKFLVIEAKSLQEERRVLDRSSSDISELMLKDKQVLLCVERVPWVTHLEFQY